MKKNIRIVIAAAVAVIVICLAVFFLQMAGVSKVRSTEPQNKWKIAAGAEIPQGKNNVLVGESGNRKLYINPASMNLIIEDKTNGLSYEAASLSAQTGEEKSILVVNYVGEDNKFLTWDSYTYSVENESYTLYQIENGVRIAMNLNEGESGRFYEYMPQKMSVERYEELFVGGLNRLVEEGTLEKAQATRYKNTLKLIYTMSRNDNNYFINYVGSPPKSAVKQLIEVAKLVGYTTEMLLEDAETYGFTVEFTEPAVFDIVLDVFLDGDELVATIPAANLVSGNDYYTIQNIEVLPNLCLVKSTDVTEGYLFVPDGAGALMKMNTYNSKVPDYVRGFYDNDYFTDYYYLPEYAQELMMPVFGMIYLEGSMPKHGFLAIVEEGADTAYVEAMLASKEEGVGRQYNKIYSTYDVSQYEWVRVFGEYNKNTSSYLVLTPQTVEDYTVRYRFYGNDVSYFKMAKDYQNYLCKGNVPGIYQTEPELYLEMVGTLSLQKRFLGIPYDVRYSMTEYDELMDILKEQAGRRLTVSYLGVFDGGMNNHLMRKGKLESANGSKKELSALLDYAASNNIDLYMETDFMKVYDGGNGFWNRIHGLEDYSKSPVDIYGYFVEVGRFKQRTNHYNLLNPVYLVDTVKDFVSGTNRTYNYYLEDLTERYYADYGNDYVSPAEAQRLADQAMDVLKADSKLALDNPRMDKVLYGDIATNVSRESSDYSTFYCTIPFRQLVMNGMTKYTTTEVNNNSDSPSYYLLQAVELGMIPKFILSAKNVDVLKDSTYSYYFSIQYELMKDSMNEVYEGFAEAMRRIGTAKITNHQVVEADVYRTEYENGTVVISNYKGIAVEYEGKTVDAKSYLILEGR